VVATDEAAADEDGPARERASGAGAAGSATRSPGMPAVQRRTGNVPRMPDPFDYAVDLKRQQIERGKHRRRVGGLWEEMGKLQLDFLVKQGLRPEHRFLDVACGSLRAGRHLVDYLDPGNYYGIDINQSLLDAGYDVELSEEQRARLPRTNLARSDRFECDFGAPFDFAIAQSLFTHISLNHIRLCLHQVAGQMRPGGKFYVTFFEGRPSFPVDKIMHEEGARRSKYTEHNVYWYYRADMRWAANHGPWKFRYVGDWGHPRHQKMVELTRVDDTLRHAKASAVTRAKSSRRRVRAVAARLSR
jgi:SAM-dependent methyltransferase